MSDLYADVIVSIPARRVDKPFTYRIPQHLESLIRAGSLVMVPFRNRHLPGYVIEIYSNAENLPSRILDIEDLLEKDALWSEEIIALARWMREYYCAPIIETLECIIPPPVRLKFSRKKKDSIFLNGHIETSFSIKNCLPVTFPEGEIALESIRAALKEENFKVFLLHGSKRKEIYRQAVSTCIALGRGVIYLIPEISSAPKEISGVIFHSGLTSRERFERWSLIVRGHENVVIGTRSAVFSPMGKIGLIIIDDEHDAAYKQEKTPRYHARQIAFKRAEYHKAVVLLGSSSPSVESYHAARKGRFHYLELHGKKEDVRVTVVDMRDEWKERKGLFSRTLLKHLRKALDSGGKVALFLNRRGFSSFIMCADCGHIFYCPRCSISLAYHQEENRFACHYCSYLEKAPDLCARCQGHNLKTMGSGTQRVQQELAHIYPDVKSVRWDSDSASDKLNLLNLDSFLKGDSRIIIGTQIISRQHLFKGVDLVGVLLADTFLHISDFRSGERTFQILESLRSSLNAENFKGEMVIQTFSPEHPAIKAISTSDHRYFYKDELANRKELGYPPFRHIIRIIFSGQDEKMVESKAISFHEKIEKTLAQIAEILGPSRCPIQRLRGKYRWHIILKALKVEKVLEILRKNLTEFEGEGITAISVDSDPMNMM